MLSFKNSLKVVENSSRFKEFKKKNQDFFLVNGFMIYEGKNSDWQIDYYDKKRDKIVSFICGDKVSMNESDILKEKNSRILELNLDKIKVDFQKVISTVKKLSKEDITKTIVILQNFKKKSIWNITELTSDFRTFNVKIDAETGKVISKSLKKIFQKV